MVSFGATRRLSLRLPPPPPGSPTVGDYLARRPDRVAAAAFPAGAVVPVAAVAQPGVYRAALPVLRFFAFAIAPTADVRVVGAPVGGVAGDKGGGRLALELIDWELGEQGATGGDGRGGLVGAYGGSAAMKELVSLRVEGDLEGLPTARGGGGGGGGSGGGGGGWRLSGEVRLVMAATRLTPPLSLLPRGVVEAVGRGVAEAVLGGVSARLGGVIVDDYTAWAAAVAKKGAGGGVD